MSKVEKLINQFLSEGLIGSDSLPLDAAKLNPDMQQNLSAAPQPVAPVQPTTDEPAVSSDVQSEPSSPQEDGADIEEIEAAQSGLLLAEYHISKFMNGLTEGEDIDLEKLRGTKQILTDARKVLSDYQSKKKLANDSSNLKESVELIGASILGIGGEEKLANINKGREPNTFLVLDDNDLNLIRKVRSGNMQAPVFFQFGGGYYSCRISRFSGNKNATIELISDKISRKDAMEKISSYSNQNLEIK